VDIVPPPSVRMKDPIESCTFSITNTGSPAKTDPALHNKNISESLNYDIYRISAVVEGSGWNVQLENNLVSIKPGVSETETLYFSHEKECSTSAKVTITARSESDPSKTVSSSFKIKMSRNK
jgi:hypothetical protein